MRADRGRLGLGDQLAAQLPGWAARRWARVRRPDDILESTRWLFVVLVLVSLLLVMLHGGSTGVSRLVATVAAVTLGASAVTGYLRRSAPVALDAVDAVAVFGSPWRCRARRRLSGSSSPPSGSARCTARGLGHSCGAASSRSRSGRP